NTNTIIIARADTFGLAQLYQLRGRVGRSDRRAYAYLLHRRGTPLPLIARKRLHAIFSASDLGAGYQIALSDLEIRGAGNILGPAVAVRMAAEASRVPEVRVEPGRVTLKWARYARQAVVTALTLAGFRPVAGSNQVRIPVASGRDGVDVALRALGAITPVARE